MRSIEERNMLVEKNLSLARTLAVKRHRTVNKTVQLGDLLSAAYLGLIDAASKYDEEKANEQAQYPFPCYARPRIAGEMNDYLRSCNWGTRANPQHLKSLDAIYDTCEDSGYSRPCPRKDVLVSEEQPVTDQLNGEELFDKIIRGLPKPAKEAFRLKFVKGLTMKKIAEELGLSESRISQILSQHTEYLGATLASRRYELWSEVI